MYHIVQVKTLLDATKTNLTRKNQPSLNELTSISIFEEIENREKLRNFSLSNFIERDTFGAKENSILCGKQSLQAWGFNLFTTEINKTIQWAENFINRLQISKINEKNLIN